MSDLISRAALFNSLATAQDKGDIFAAIQNAPAVDAVESEQRLIEYTTKRYLRKMAMFEQRYTMETEKDKETLFRFIEDAPAVDAVPVVHGHWRRPLEVWNKTSSYRYECSACGKIAHQVTGNCGRKIKQSNPKCTYSFCPNCGAKMDEEVSG